MTLRPRIVLTGDSLTQYAANPSFVGWGILLQNEYVRSADVLNRGLSGYTSRWFKQHALPSLLEEWTHHGAPSIVTLCLGANDSALLTGDSDRQHVPLTEYKQNMQEILLSMRKAAPECIIILMTPPPVDDFIRAKSHTPIDRCDKAVKEYAEICLELGTTLTLPVIDLYQEFHSVGETWPSLFCDGLHFSASGNHKVYELIKKTIDEKYPQWKSSILPWQLPDHKSFN